MIFKVFIHEDVYDELDRITRYYEEKQKDLGLKFLDDWETSLNQLVKNPLIFQLKFKKIRSVQFSTFPFLIIFEVEKDSVLIFKVIHARRNPAAVFRKKT